MELLPTNASIFSPRGFRPRVPDPRSVVEVPAGSVWGADDVARLRDAAMVRVTEPATGPSTPPRVVDATAPGRELGAQDLTMRTVLWLALAGVPVAGEGLPTAVRDRLDPELLDLLDRVIPASVVDAAVRELLSLALRRRARGVVTGCPYRTVSPVLVLLPQDPTTTLLEDLGAQTWPTVLQHPDNVAIGEDVTAWARQVGARWCTRVSADVRYGPHHLADLVDALRHSGDPVAHSPLRLRPWREGTWLEDDRLGVESTASGGLEGGSIWHVRDGHLPPTYAQGYSVHGANAVPAAPVVGSEPAALRLHQHRPAVLDWLVPSGGGEEALTPYGAGPAAPPSYFATRTRSRARNATTASEI